ncbi:MAG: efflux RND transporter periplasmic adaptor subunit [Nonlabens sp.]
MKYYSYLIIALLIVSCGGGDPTVEELIAGADNKAIADRKVQLLNQKKELETQITAIENYLEENTVKKEGALVSVATVTDTLFNHYIELQGSVSTKKNVTLMPEMPGILTHVYVKEGDRVRRGQRLARIDDGGLSQQIEQMKVQADLAKTTFERQERLWEQNIGSEIQFLQAKANYESQKNAINSMNQQLGKSIVTAPFDGVVDDVITEQGNTVSPGMTQLLRLVNLDDMYIEVEVPETYIASVDQGTMVTVEFPVLGEELNSTVRQSSTFINPANRSFKIEVPVPNKEGKIKPNLTARLKINDYTAAGAILIPSAVINENQQGEQYVMVATSIKENGEQYDTAIAKRRIVKTGKTTTTMVEVTSGLEMGDVIIVEGARSVREDQEIRISRD